MESYPQYYKLPATESYWKIESPNKGRYLRALTREKGMYDYCAASLCKTDIDTLIKMPGLEKSDYMEFRQAYEKVSNYWERVKSTIIQ
ncbi:hypothetical protein [Siphonobacter sp. SORGH_AS_0500]|uniref:hypothetical protein n=1 Tax=Siphonobacter sp. SORGH_AS_0500 TaxID=1864824 RepID=UPI0028673D00|nr:hypothetical protein [Siphonobacter sp. SORGH_AS_0500]MDR6196177.1 hypothetical protein [Siphonobacter sp. SORGH_AS_0500]